MYEIERVHSCTLHLVHSVKERLWNSTFFADFLFGVLADLEDCKSTMKTPFWRRLTFLAFFRRSPGMSDGFWTFLFPVASPIAPMAFLLKLVDNIFFQIPTLGGLKRFLLQVLVLRGRILFSAIRPARHLHPLFLHLGTRDLGGHSSQQF